MKKQKKKGLYSFLYFVYDLLWKNYFCVQKIEYKYFNDLNHMKWISSEPSSAFARLQWFNILVSKRNHLKISPVAMKHKIVNTLFEPNNLKWKYLCARLTPKIIENLTHAVFNLSYVITLDQNNICCTQCTSPIICWIDK